MWPRQGSGADCALPKGSGLQGVGLLWGLQAAKWSWRDQAAGARPGVPGELAVTLDVGDVFIEVTHESSGLTVHLTLFHATIREGVPQNLEHNDIRWITVAKIEQYEFCPADEVILDEIKANSKRTGVQIAAAACF